MRHRLKPDGRRRASRSGPMSARRAASGSRGVDPSCATRCHAQVSSTSRREKGSIRGIDTPRPRSLKTNMARTTGRAPKGARLIDHAPFARWSTRTFIAALRPCGRMRLGSSTANEPGVVRSLWQNAVGSGLAAGRRDHSRQPVFPKEPRRGGGHEGSRSVVSLPSAPWQAGGQVCDLFTEEECCTLFKAAGHEADQPQHALIGQRPLQALKAEMHITNSAVIRTLSRLNNCMATSANTKKKKRLITMLPEGLLTA